MKESCTSREGFQIFSACEEIQLGQPRRELLNGSRFVPQKKTAMEIFQFLEIWYHRKKAALIGFCTPAQIEELLNQKPLAA